jgi:CRISPR/Cas system-associated exonuclease Cas4 (RecB family)
MLNKGMISSVNYKDLEEEILEMLKDPVVANWFAPDWKILNESGIIEKGKGVQRPDRTMIRGKEVVVVDYKTGETERRSYHAQLKRYMTALRKMGFTQIKGYIWYLRLKKVEEVMNKE